MNDADRQLVDLITQQVLALLQSRGLLQQGGSSVSSNKLSHASPAPIHPPIGVCTGDYSKFPELAGKLSPTRNPQPGTRNPEPPEDYDPRRLTPGRVVPNVVIPRRQEPPEDFAPPAGFVPAPSSPVYQPIPLSGIVTANQLQEAMKASADGVAYLTPDAKLTPLANDLARQKPQNIKRSSPAAPAGHTSSSASSAAASQYVWWIEGACPVVREVIPTYGAALRPIASDSHRAALPNVVRELARMIKARQVTGGVLFVPSASRAICYANRCSSIRAFVATCGEAVEQGLRDLGANVMVIEYPHQGRRAMTAMLDRFMQTPPVVPPAVERDLADLHRC
ncbi:MAG: hypothetical protein WD768_19825 [Phycisphaeraceae bacterium]